GIRSVAHPSRVHSRTGVRTCADAAFHGRARTWLAIPCSAPIYCSARRDVALPLSPDVAISPGRQRPGFFMVLRAPAGEGAEAAPGAQPWAAWNSASEYSGLRSRAISRA